jgi:hypothetical protein
MHGQGRRLRSSRALPALAAGACALLLPAAAHASVTVGDVQVAEADADVTVTFTIARDARLLAPAITVSFATVDASAVAAADYAAASGTRTFPAAVLGGPQAQQVSVTIRGDLLDEPSETFRLVVTGPEVVDGEGVATIADDDPSPAVRVLDAAPVGERAGPAAFAVVLSAPSGREVSVDVATADGSATAPADYAARTGRVTIPAGAVRAVVPVTVVDDLADEPAETFALRLAAPTNATLGVASGGGTILDDDEPPAAGAPAAGGGAPGATGPSSPGASRPGAGSPRLGMTAPRLRRPATVLVTLSCPASAGRCHGRLTLFSLANRRSRIRALRSERTLLRRRFALGGGASTTLRVPLRRTDRRLLARAGRIRVRAYAVVEDAAGRAGVRTVTGTLISRTAHSR